MNLFKWADSAPRPARSTTVLRLTKGILKICHTLIIHTRFSRKYHAHNYLIYIILYFNFVAVECIVCVYMFLCFTRYFKHVYYYIIVFFFCGIARGIILYNIVNRIYKRDETKWRNAPKFSRMCEWTGTTLPSTAPTHYVPSGVSMPAARRAHTYTYKHTHRAAGDAFWPSARQCHHRPDSGVSCVASASVRAGFGSLSSSSSSLCACTTHICGGAPRPFATTMKKHSKQLEKRIEDQQRLAAAAGSDRRRSSKCKNGGILKNESSPELSRPVSRKSRQYFLEPIRRWNSFHNSRERKSTAAAAATAAVAAAGDDSAAVPASPSSTSSLPYLQTLVNLQRESKSACARLAQSVLPKIPRVTESAPILGVATAATYSATQSPVQHHTAAGNPAKKQNSSPNLLLQVYDRRQQGSTAGTSSGNSASLTNSPRRSARRPKTPPPQHHHHQHQQQSSVAAAAVNITTTAGTSSSCGAATDATAGSSAKIPFAIIVGDTPIVPYKEAVPRIKAIRADSMSEKSSSYLAVDLSPHRRYSFWSVIEYYCVNARKSLIVIIQFSARR